MLVQEAEALLNKGERIVNAFLRFKFIVPDLAADKIPVKYEPWRSYQAEDQYSLIVTSPFIFGNLANASASSLPIIKRGSLNGKFHSPYRYYLLTNVLRNGLSQSS